MPFDVSIIQPFGQVSKVLPMTKTFTPRKLTTLDPEKLSTLLAKEKIAYKKSNIVFLDCQSWDDNYGNQIHGAIHLDISLPSLSLTKFNSVIKAKRNVYNKIGGADLVVIYCKQASDRSPTIMALYQDAVSNVATRPEIYNPNQTVLLLAGGIKAYTEDVSDGPPYLINYVGLAKTPQHAGDDYFEIYE